MVFQLDDNEVGFPDPSLGEPDGLLAVGGALTPDWLLTAYSYGIFPWFGFREHDEIMWWCPMDRFVIFPDEIHVSHSMRQLINSGKYSVTVNEAFDEVILACSKAQHRDEQEGAWLGDDMVAAYREMHRQHFAASIEVWEQHAASPPDAPADAVNTEETEGRTLVGGLYGVNIGRNFFGESMFSLVPSASKLALIHLASLLEGTGGIIDCQFETAHLRSMGGRHISYDEYMAILSSE